MIGEEGREEEEKEEDLGRERRVIRTGEANKREREREFRCSFILIILCDHLFSWAFGVEREEEERERRN